MVDVLETLMKLPKQCVVTDLTDPALTVIIARGVRGYYPFRRFNGDAEAKEFAEKFNERAGITKAQVAAMEAGSMFGWEVPAADPDQYDAEGGLLPGPLGWDKVEGGARAHD